MLFWSYSMPNRNTWIWPVPLEGKFHAEEIPCRRNFKKRNLWNIVWNIVGARCRVQDPKLLMALWWRDSKIPKTIWSCDKASIWCFLRGCRNFTVVLNYWPECSESLFINQLVFCDSVMKRVFLFQNIVDAEYIVCTYWLNIAGAAAPTAPMVPATMNMFKFACYRRTYSMVIVHTERRLHFRCRNRLVQQSIPASSPEQNAAGFH